MTSEQISQQVQAAYRQAMQNRNVQYKRSSGIEYLLRGLKLYGRDAGVDFAKTHLDAIVREAIEAAGYKASSIAMTAGGFGRSALDGMARALQQLTGLQVYASGSTVTLAWAEVNTGFP